MESEILILNFIILLSQKTLLELSFCCSVQSGCAGPLGPGRSSAVNPKVCPLQGGSCSVPTAPSPPCMRALAHCSLRVPGTLPEDAWDSDCPQTFDLGLSASLGGGSGARIISSARHRKKLNCLEARFSERFP